MENKRKLKPFVKWAGGKSQLIPEIVKRLPNMTGIGEYVEPFVGGGAVLFYILENYPDLKCTINDLNKDLINLYSVVKNNPEPFLSALREMEEEYNTLPSDDERERFYYSLRNTYNKDDFHNQEKERQAAVFLALNKLGFNGLYRLNKEWKLNVPFGKRRGLHIWSPDYFHTLSDALRNVTIMCGDYSKTAVYAGSRALYYLDPPYKPLDTAKTKLNQYTASGFDDEEQVKLKLFCDKIGDKGSKLILSDSDTLDGYFDGLYGNDAGYKISRVEARRAINCKGDKRGKINELIITNF